MDVNLALHRHQLALMRQERAATAEERRAYVQFARDYSVQIQITRDDAAAPSVVAAFRHDQR
jgi:hypothetical protein